MSLVAQIGVKKLRTTSQTLTGSYVQLAETTGAGSQPENKAVKTQQSNQIVVCVDYTAATADAPLLFVRVDFGLNGVDANTPPTTWYSDTVQDSYASGTSTLIVHDYKFAGSNGTALHIPISVPVTCVWARVMVKETVGSGSQGVVTGSATYAEV